MIVDTDACVEYVMNNYGVCWTSAKNIIDDFGLWEEIEEKREKGDEE